jgi:hypothetical protein
MQIGVEGIDNLLMWIWCCKKKKKKKTFEKHESNKHLFIPIYLNNWLNGFQFGNYPKDNLWSLKLCYLNKFQ